MINGIKGDVENILGENKFNFSFYFFPDNEFDQKILLYSATKIMQVWNRAALICLY